MKVSRKKLVVKFIDSAVITFRLECTWKLSDFEIIWWHRR